MGCFSVEARDAAATRFSGRSLWRSGQV